MEELDIRIEAIIKKAEVEVAANSFLSKESRLSLDELSNDPKMIRQRAAYHERIKKIKSLIKPGITLSPRLHENVASCIAALGNSSYYEIFSRNKSIVMVEKGDSPSIRVLNEYTILELLSGSAVFLKAKPKKDDEEESEKIQVPPPISLAQIVKNSSQISLLPELEKIITAPTLRPDGSFLYEEGYDEETKLYLIPQREYPELIDDPKPQYISKCVNTLIEPFSDFPFENPTLEMSRVIAAMMTITFRHFFKIAPMFPVRSNIKGAGKTKLATCISLAATGEEPKMEGGLTNDQDELKKAMIGISQAGKGVVCFDNANQVIGNRILDMILTYGEMSGRLLGKNENPDHKFNMTFFATGNNMKFTDDMSRRIVPISITTQDPNPSRRTGFKHDNLEEYIKEKHPEMLAALLALMKAYFVAGRPRMDMVPMGSFEQWSSYIRGALIFAGFPDPYEGVTEDVEQDDESTVNFRELLHAWYRLFPDKDVTLAEVLMQIKRMEYSAGEEAADANELAIALKAYDHSRGNELNVRSISRNLPVSQLGSRVIDGMQMRCKLDRTKKKVYSVYFVSR